MIPDIDRIIPNESIGSFELSMTFTCVLEQVESRGEQFEILDSRNGLVSGYKRITTKDIYLYFGPDDKLYQIGVTFGFEGKLEGCIGVGESLTDIINVYGGYYKDEFGLFYPVGIKGVCFELGDYEDPDDQWDEMKAPIEWIFVYKED